MNPNPEITAIARRVIAEAEAGVKYIEVTVPFSERVDSFTARLRRQIVKVYPYVSIRWLQGDPANGDLHKLIILGETCQDSPNDDLPFYDMDAADEAEALRWYMFGDIIY